MGATNPREIETHLEAWPHRTHLVLTRKTERSGAGQEWRKVLSWYSPRVGGRAAAIDKIRSLTRIPLSSFHYGIKATSHLGKGSKSHHPQTIGKDTLR